MWTREYATAAASARSGIAAGGSARPTPVANANAAAECPDGNDVDTGQAGLVVVAVSDMGAKVERAMERAAKVEQREIEADSSEIERDAAEAAG